MPDAPQYTSVTLDPEEFIPHCGIVVVGLFLVDKEGVGDPECVVNVAPQPNRVQLGRVEGQPLILPELSEVDINGKVLK